MPCSWASLATVRARAWVLSLAAFLLVAGLLPRGWMPVAGADGITMVICTGAGAVEARLDLGAGQQPAHPADEANKVCGFASAAPVPPPVGPVLPHFAAAWLPAAPTRGPPPARLARAPVRLPPSHAPPATA